IDVTDAIDDALDGQEQPVSGRTLVRIHACHIAAEQRGADRKQRDQHQELDPPRRGHLQLLRIHEREHEVRDREHAEHEPDDGFGTAHAAACSACSVSASTRWDSVSGPTMISQALTNTTATAKKATMIARKITSATTA